MEPAASVPAPLTGVSTAALKHTPGVHFMAVWWKGWMGMIRGPMCPPSSLGMNQHMPKHRVLFTQLSLVSPVPSSP